MRSPARFVSCTAVGAALLLGTTLAFAQASGCTPLGSQPVTPNVDYYQQIQPIWEQSCANCHVNHGGGPSAGLDLDLDWSWSNLFEVGSAIAPGRVMAVPGSAATSFLFEKINCGTPTVGELMPRGRLPIPAAEQALIRDWLNQGAREAPDVRLFGNGFEPVSAAAPR